MRFPCEGIGWSLRLCVASGGLGQYALWQFLLRNLSVVLEGLVAAPFEPLESVPERILTLKVTLLLALTSLKRVGDLQALSVSEMFYFINKIS